MTDVILECKNISKSYLDGDQKVSVINDLTLSIELGEKLAIVGPSGSGKSTLLHLLGGLDLCTSGNVFFKGIAWTALSEVKRCMARNCQLGFIYQFHHLLPDFTALENVMLPLLINKEHAATAKMLALEKLNSVGLSHRVSHKPGQLSGGERQRVAIARALIREPLCILADEPTGNLDGETAKEVFDVLLNLNSEMKTSLIIVTHDLMLAAKMDRQLTLS